MPYAMTHLIIANNISEFLNYNTKSLPQYFLGSIAPDSIQSRTNFNPDNKKKSHLFVGSEAWGYMTNHNECVNNVIDFLITNKQSENFDFIIGYCIHILSDIYHHLIVTTPLRNKNAYIFDELYSQESIKVNIELALTCDVKDQIWSYLKNSIAVELPGIVCFDDIQKIKNHVLNDWYQDKTNQNLTSNKIITFENNMNYIDRATKYIILILQKLEVISTI